MRFIREEADGRKMALYPNFDIISGMKCVLLRRRKRLSYFENIALYPNYDTGVFPVLCYFCLISFHRRTLCLLETKRFASIEDSVGLSTLCDLSEAFSKPILKHIAVKKVPQLLFFLRICFSVEQNRFLLFSVRIVVFESHVYPFSYFSHCKTDEHSTTYPFAYLKTFLSVTFRGAPT